MSESEASVSGDESVPELSTNEPSTINALSKNQQKKRKREEYLRKKKIEKKEAEKKRKLENRLAVASGEKSSDMVKEHHSRSTRSSRSKVVSEHYLASYENSFAVIIDCNWESIHHEGAMKSLSNQVSYCYGANRKHSHPCKMYVTGLGPRLSEKLKKMNNENWQGVTCSSEEYTANTEDFTISKVSSSSSDATAKQPKQLVYLTADSDNLIETLDPSCAYIIGGIVDRNSAKGQTLAKAVAQNVTTGRLPIRENFALTSSQVLTVNHVFEILLNYAQSQSWSEAIEKVLPKRKVVVPGAATTVDAEGEDDQVESPEEDEANVEQP